MQAGLSELIILLWFLLAMTMMNLLDFDKIFTIPLHSWCFVKYLWSFLNKYWGDYIVLCVTINTADIHQINGMICIYIGQNSTLLLGLLQKTRQCCSLLAFSVFTTDSFNCNNKKVVKSTHPSLKMILGRCCCSSHDSALQPDLLWKETFKVLPPSFTERFKYIGGENHSLNAAE